MVGLVIPPPFPSQPHPPACPSSQILSVARAGQVKAIHLDDDAGSVGDLMSAARDLGIYTHMIRCGILGVEP